MNELLKYSIGACVIGPRLKKSLDAAIDAEVEIYSAQEQAISTAIMLLEQWNIFETEWYFMIFVSHSIGGIEMMSH